MALPGGAGGAGAGREHDVGALEPHHEAGHGLLSQIELGRPAMRTISLHMMRLALGVPTAPHRTTTNNIYAVVSGSARFTCEGGLAETLGGGDLIAVPCWHAHTIEAPAAADIFRVSDAPLLAKLGLGRSPGD